MGLAEVFEMLGGEGGVSPPCWTGTCSVSCWIRELRAAMGWEGSEFDNSTDVSWCFIGHLDRDGELLLSLHLVSQNNNRGGFSGEGEQVFVFWPFLLPSLLTCSVSISHSVQAELRGDMGTRSCPDNLIFLDKSSKAVTGFCAGWRIGSAAVY